MTTALERVNILAVAAYSHTASASKLLTKAAKTVRFVKVPGTQQ